MKTALSKEQMAVIFRDADDKPVLEIARKHRVFGHLRSQGRH
jgi:hypothetical protein